MLFWSVQAESLKGSFCVFLVSPFWFFKLIIMKFGKTLRLLKGKEKESKNLYFCFFFFSKFNLGCKVWDFWTRPIVVFDTSRIYHEFILVFRNMPVVLTMHVGFILGNC